jgi:hypothetical protein
MANGGCYFLGSGDSFMAVESFGDETGEAAIAQGIMAPIGRNSPASEARRDDLATAAAPIEFASKPYGAGCGGRCARWRKPRASCDRS